MHDGELPDDDRNDDGHRKLETNRAYAQRMSHHCQACEERAYRDGYVAGVKTVANKQKNAGTAILMTVLYVLAILYVLRMFAEEEPQARIRSMRGASSA